MKKIMSFKAGIAAVCSVAILVTITGFAPNGGGPMGGNNSSANDMKANAGTQKSISVNVTSPKTETLERTTQFAAKLEPSSTVKVYSKVSGTVDKVFFNVGDKVNKGDLLFTIDTKDAQKSLVQQQLSYDSTMLKIESEESGSSNALTVMKYENAIESARKNYVTQRESLNVATDDDFDLAEFVKLRKKLKAAEEKYQKEENEENWTTYKKALDEYDELMDDYASYANYRSLVTSFENSYDNYLQAEQEYEIYKSQTTGENTEDREIRRQQAEISLQNAQENLANHSIYAPASGIISSKNVNSFDMVSTQTVAFVITNSDSDEVSVSFNLSQDGAASSQIGNEIAVIYKDKSYSAVITEISPEVDSATGLYAAKAVLNESIGTKVSGTIVKVQSITSKEENALTLPIDLVSYDGNEPYVYIFSDNTAKQVFLTLGMETADTVSITSGLSENDLVISTWHPNLKDGAAVELYSNEKKEG